MAALTIRRLRLDEAGVAARLHRAVGRAAWGWTPDLTTPAAELRMYRETVFATGEVTGAFEGDALCGFVATLPGWVEHLYIATNRQGRGIGSRLLAVAMTAQDDLQLWTYQANIATRRFYERHGFVAVEVTDGAALPEREPNVRYRWTR